MNRSAEIAHLASDSVVAAITELDVVDVSGRDAASYLHGQLSQDVESLAVGETRWTLLLQPQGKVDAWMRIHRLGPEQFLLLVDGGYGSAVEARLQRFKLRVEAEIKTSTRPVLALRGPATGPVVDSLELKSPMISISADWGGPGVDLIPASGSEVEIQPPTGVLSVAPDELEMIRISRGQPAMGAELDESTIPAAAGVVDVSVDFSKGCYVGQELVARIDSRGNNTPTRLVRLDIAAPAGDVQPGAELSSGGGSVGTVTSVAPAPGADDRSIGLGYIKRGTEIPGEAQLGLGDGRNVSVALRPLRD